MVVKFMTVATSGKGGGAHEEIQCETKIYERSSLLSVESALGLMISFGTFTVALIVAVVQIVNNQNNKK